MVATWLPAGRRRAVKLTVVLLGVAWCSSWPLAPVVRRALVREVPPVAQAGPGPFEEGLARARRSDWHGARLAFLRAAREDADPGMRPLVFAWLEHAAREIGGPLETVRTFEAMRRLDRSDSLARLHLCRALLDRGFPGDVDDAAHLVREGIASGDEHSYDLHRIAAELALARGNLPAARAQLEAAQRDAPSGPFIRVMAWRPPATQPATVAQ